MCVGYWTIAVNFESVTAYEYSHRHAKGVSELDFWHPFCGKTGIWKRKKCAKKVKLFSESCLMFPLSLCTFLSPSFAKLNKNIWQVKSQKNGKDEWEVVVMFWIIYIASNISGFPDFQKPFFPTAVSDLRRTSLAPWHPACHQYRGFRWRSFTFSISLSISVLLFCVPVGSGPARDGGPVS